MNFNEEKKKTTTAHIYTIYLNIPLLSQQLHFVGS